MMYSKPPTGYFNESIRLRKSITKKVSELRAAANVYVFDGDIQAASIESWQLISPQGSGGQKSLNSLIIGFVFLKGWDIDNICAIEIDRCDSGNAVLLHVLHDERMDTFRFNCSEAHDLEKITTCGMAGNLAFYLHMADNEKTGEAQILNIPVCMLLK